MIRSFLFVVVAAMLLSGVRAADGDALVGVKPLHVTMSVYEGDPTDPLSAKILATFEVVTPNGSPFSFGSGLQKVAVTSDTGVASSKVIGLCVSGTPYLTKDGEARVDLQIEKSKRSDPADRRSQIDLNHVSTTALGRVNEDMKLDLKNGLDATTRIWIELRIDEAKMK